MRWRSESGDSSESGPGACEHTRGFLHRHSESAVCSELTAIDLPLNAYTPSGRRPAMSPFKFLRLDLSLKSFWLNVFPQPPPMPDHSSTGTLSSILQVTNGQYVAVSNVYNHYTNNVVQASSVIVDPTTITPGVELERVDPHPSVRIDKIELWKMVSNFPEHEYVVLYVSKDNVPTYGVVKVERSVNSDPLWIAKTSTASLHKVSTALYDGGVPAEDRLWVNTNTNTEGQINVFAAEPDRCVYAYVYPLQDRPSLTRLVAAAQVVHQSQTDYILLEAQCYWFAGVIFRLLVGPNAEQLRSETPARAMEPLPAGTDRDFEIAAGALFVKWFKIVTQKAIDECCAQLAPAFEAEVQSLEHNITAQLSANAVKEAAAAADREGRERAEAERERAEAERKRAEAERDAEREGRKRAEAELEFERKGRESAEADAASLRAELARLTGAASPST
ncbi:hypothetical protein BC628DRAFT_1103317 [Trametes gibbosa]|nr:hypothetical protein BC628DRAFT_1103317 [Trametes gibbosa]